LLLGHLGVWVEVGRRRVRAVFHPRRPPVLLLLLLLGDTRLSPLRLLLLLGHALVVLCKGSTKEPWLLLRLGRWLSVLLLLLLLLPCIQLLLLLLLLVIPSKLSRNDDVGHVGWKGGYIRVQPPEQVDNNSEGHLREGTDVLKQSLEGNKSVGGVVLREHGRKG